MYVAPVKTIFKVSALVAILGGCVGRVGYRAAVVVPAPAVVVEAPPPPPPAPEPVVYVEPAPAVEVAYVEPAAFIYIGPDIQVIDDYEYPVFFTGGLYWRQEGGVWYSSSYHDRGWAMNADVPAHVRGIERPNQYVHYHADVHARVGQPGYRAPVTAPIHHTAPPPRFVEHPGHPVAAHPNAPGRVEPPGREAHPMPPGHVEPPGQAGHPMGPPGHAEPPGQAGHPMGPPGHAEPPMHDATAVTPGQPPGQAGHPMGPPPGHAPPPPAARAPAPPPAAHPAPPAKAPPGKQKK
jgi:hypothetical protein